MRDPAPHCSLKHQLIFALKHLLYLWFYLYSQTGNLEQQLSLVRTKCMQHKTRSKCKHRACFYGMLPSWYKIKKLNSQYDLFTVWHTVKAKMLSSHFAHTDVSCSICWNKFSTGTSVCLNELGVKFLWHLGGSTSIHLFNPKKQVWRKYNKGD